jgi:hypothetical protein
MPPLRQAGARGLAFAAVAMIIATADCVRAMKNTATPGTSPVSINALWEPPSDLEQRDLFHGPGGAALMPKARQFEFVAVDTSGKSPGYDVRDANGLLWSVKLGVEAQSEVATSRVFWAIGFHQPPTYYLSEWSLKGQESGARPAARFRPESPSEEVIGDWSWYENPFIGTVPFRGLIAANLIVNNWDWKTSNNKIYRTVGGGREARVRYVVRDIGASLGRTKQFPLLSWLGLPGGQGTKNDLPGFESQGFVTADENGDLDFDYNGRYADLVWTVTVEDLRWTCELLSRLSDAQWNDAFRAAGYTPNERKRYIAKIKQKLKEGLAVVAVARPQF